MQPGDTLLAPRKVTVGKGPRWIVEAFYIVRQQPLTWALLALAYLVINLLIGMVPLFGKLISFCLAPVFSAGFILAAIKSEEGSELELTDLFAGFKAGLRPLINVSILYMIVLVVLGVVLSLLMDMMGVSVAKSDPGVPPVISGSFALVAFIGGASLVLLSMASWLAPALVILNQAGPWQAICASLKAAISNWGAVLLSGLMLAVLALIAIVPIGLGLLLWFPVLYVTAYTGWKDLFGHPPASQSAEESVVF